jgi:hypothetical protein
MEMDYGNPMEMEMDYGNPLYLEDKQLHLAADGDGLWKSYLLGRQTITPCRSRLLHGSPKAHYQKSISVTILTSTAWGTLGLFGVSFNVANFTRPLLTSQF